MKKYALNVHALSTLYSTVITDVINPGFSLAMKSSHYAEGSTELAIANKQQGLKLYLADAEKMCSESSLKVSHRPVLSFPPAPPPDKFLEAPLSRQMSPNTDFFSFSGRLTCKNFPAQKNKANKTLNDRLDELDRAHQRQTPRRATTGVPLSIAPSTTSRTLLDTNRNRRFSRLNPFRRDR